MHLLPRDPADELVFEFCEQWLACLVAGDYAAARAMLVEDGFIPWTAEMIEEEIGGYGGSVTLPATATGDPGLDRLEADADSDDVSGAVHPRYPFAVYWFVDGPARNGALGWVHLDYPIDGRWSHLASEFHIVVRDELLGLDLERIEEM